MFILTDVNKDNLICLGNELKEVNSDNIIIIDHHDEGEHTVNSNEKYIRASASSASEMVIKLLNMFKIKYPEEVANYLLVGIYLDTNKLTKNVTPETLKIIARLLETGANKAVVYNWFAEDFESDKRVSDLVSKTKIYKYSFAVVLAEEGCEYTKEELARVADYLLKYGVDASFAIENVEENIISISARSKGNVNVGEVMSQLQGVGNRYSGVTKLADQTTEEVGKELIKIIQSPYVIHE